MAKVLMSGNEAIGEAAISAGCRFYAGYPITPQNELTAYMAKRMDEVGGVFIQSESELAAINMVFGASAVGSRAMTSSSSPGISLKQEGMSYIAGCLLPAVVVNVVRGGPGLGNIAPAQSDYFQATRGGGHGDYRQIVLGPSTVQEAFDFTYEAFDLADRYRILVMILADGLLGQMMEPIRYSVLGTRYSVENRKPKTEYLKPWALTGCKGRPPNVIKSLFLGEGELEEYNDRLQEKYNQIKKNETRCETSFLNDSNIVVVAFGTMSRIVKGAVLKARKKGIKVGLVRPITLWPFPYNVIEETARKIDRFLVVEMNKGQMLEDVIIGAKGKCRIDFFGRAGGGIPDEDQIIHRILG